MSLFVSFREIRGYDSGLFRWSRRLGSATLRGKKCGFLFLVPCFGRTAPRSQSRAGSLRPYGIDDNLRESADDGSLIIFSVLIRENPWFNGSVFLRVLCG